MVVDNFIPIIFFTGGMYKPRGQVPRNWAAKFGFGRRSQEGKHPWREENRQLDTGKKDSSFLVQFFFASDIFFQICENSIDGDSMIHVCGEQAYII